MTEEVNKNKNMHGNEIDLISLTRITWNGRRTILKIILLFMAIGLAIALFSPKEYTASTTMVPQLSDGSSKMNGLSSLAAMAGFNLNMSKGSGELSPYIYPQIVESVPFQLELMNIPFTFSEIDQPISIYEYFTEFYKPGFLFYVKNYTIGLPFVILNAIKPAVKQELPLGTGKELKSPIYLTKEQDEVRNILTEGVTLETNDKDGYVTLRVSTYDPKLAADVAQEAQELLQKYITNFKIEKANSQLNFIEERYNDNKTEFEAAQVALAEFRDKNKNVTSARARTQEERLQSEYQLAFDVYSELAQQLEQARIQVKEDTPVFSIIKPVTVPLEKSKPNRPIILIVWTFLGGIIGISWVFGKRFMGIIKEKWNA